MAAMSGPNNPGARTCDVQVRQPQRELWAGAERRRSSRQRANEHGRGDARPCVRSRGVRVVAQSSVKKTIGKPCAGNPQARFERGFYPFTDEPPFLKVKGQNLPMAPPTHAPPPRVSKRGVVGEGEPTTLPSPWREGAEHAGGVVKFAEALGVARNTVFGWVSGDRMPSRLTRRHVNAWFRERGLVAPFEDT